MDVILSFVKDYFSLMLLFFLLAYLSPNEQYRGYFHFFISVLIAAVLAEPVFSVLGGADGDQTRETLHEIVERMGSYDYEQEGESLYEQYLGTTEETE